MKKHFITSFQIFRSLNIFTLKIICLFFISCPNFANNIFLLIKNYEYLITKDRYIYDS